MAENSTDDNSKLVDMDDLDSFEDVFYGRTKEPEPKAETKEDDPEIEDDSLETHEDIEAESEDETPEEDEAPKAQEPKKKKSAKERIDELTAERYAAERERDAEKAQRAALEARLQALEKAQKPVEQPQSAPQAEASAPNPNAVNEKGEPIYPLGEFDTAFVRDLTRYQFAEEAKAYENRQRQQAEEARLNAEKNQLQQSWNEKVDKVKDELPDYQENVTKLTQTFGHIDPQYGEYIATTIMSCDNGPEIMYYLSQNIGEAQKIVASGPFAATLAIGRLQAKFESTGDTGNSPQKKVSSAPEPPTERVRGRGGQFSVRPDTDDLDAFEKEFFKRR